MGRRTSGSIVGLEKIGLVQADANTLTTTQPNTDINLEPNGTGEVHVQTNLNIADQSDLRFFEQVGNGLNYAAIQAPATLAGNYTLTLPTALTPTSGYVLSSSDTGVLSWISAGGAVPVTDAGSTATVHYLFFGTNAGSIPSSLDPLVRNNLSFVPSTGTLTTTAGVIGTITGGTGSGANLVLRSTSNASKGQVFIDETTASSSTTTGALRVGGGVGVSGQLTATTVVETSSLVFKENINPIDNALELVTKLVGVTYDRKDNNEFESGLIAEEVYKVIPEVVSLDTEGNPYGIKYSKLTAYLIEAVKTLNIKIDELKNK